MPATEYPRFEYFQRTSGANAAARAGISARSSSVVGNSNVVQCAPASRGRPELCVSSSSMVIGGSSLSDGSSVNHGRYFETGSSSRSLPCSRSCITAVAVNSLLCEAMRNLVCGVIGTLRATSAKPKPVAQTRSWSETTPTATPGRPRSIICPSSQAVNRRCAPCTSASEATRDGGDDCASRELDDSRSALAIVHTIVRILDAGSAMTSSIRMSTIAAHYHAVRPYRGYPSGIYIRAMQRPIRSSSKWDRRSFLTATIGAAAAAPLIAHEQQPAQAPSPVPAPRDWARPDPVQY